MSEDDNKKFSATIKVLNKERKKDSKMPLVMSGADILNAQMNKQSISTGITSLDNALSGGWFPGRIYEIFGPASSGKTTICMEAIAECQRQGHKCAFIDVEHTFNAEYALKCGIDLDKLVLAVPHTAEEAMRAALILAQSGTVKLIVLDSVAQLVPKKEAENDIEKETIGLLARFVTKSLKKINPCLEQNETILLLINQERTKMEGIFTSITTTGGKMLHYACTGRLKVRKTEWLGTADNIYGQKSEIKIVKHKLGPPMRSCKIDIIFEKGIDKFADLAEVLFENPYTGVDKNGAWIKVDGVSVCQGAARFSEWLEENEKEREQLKERLKKITNTPAIDQPSLSFKPIVSSKSK